jgi:hypothetical protein
MSSAWFSNPLTSRYRSQVNSIRIRTVAVDPSVTGFVKTIRVDRGLVSGRWPLSWT